MEKVAVAVWYFAGVIALVIGAIKIRDEFNRRELIREAEIECLQNQIKLLKLKVKITGKMSDDEIRTLMATIQSNPSDVRPVQEDGFSDALEALDTAITPTSRSNTNRDPMSELISMVQNTIQTEKKEAVIEETVQDGKKVIKTYTLKHK